jgi:hypothetical protein
MFVAAVTIVALFRQDERVLVHDSAKYLSEMKIVCYHPRWCK